MDRLTYGVGPQRLALIVTGIYGLASLPSGCRGGAFSRGNERIPLPPV